MYILRRRFVKRSVVALLLAGAIVNVAVAWGSVVLLCGWRDAAESTWINAILVYPDDFPTPTVRAGNYWRLVSAADLRFHKLFIGWPAICLHSADNHVLVRQSTIKQDVEVLIALRPIWPGFAINTIFYAAVLGMVFVIPVQARRSLRRRRGLCPVCGYPSGSSHVCTECGQELLVCTHFALMVRLTVPGRSWPVSPILMTYF